MLDLFGQLFGNNDAAGSGSSHSDEHVSETPSETKTEISSASNEADEQSVVAAEPAAADRSEPSRTEQHSEPDRSVNNVVPIRPEDRLPASADTSDDEEHNEEEETQASASASSDEPRDLFGEIIQSAPNASKGRTSKPESKKVSSSSAVATAAASSAKRGWQDQDIEVGIDFTVHYATRTFLVSELIDEIPESGTVHLNKIREALFREYWDFSESRTKWDYDLEEKKLRPIIVGEKNNAV
ncbi:hypothetical protein [Cohnella sp. AR92]|uniref:hypothetical protein n=1 Tax=Cohnella sp. AR92 TaxID=648716 RepID=UPI000F8E73E8|nr:hypothetical protein [Cohnella sp. AR92]RUS44914.1 hypothetical protein ELR57_21905 [Cohnella sp. AR92]